MRLGLNIGYSGSSIDNALPLVQHADEVGIDSVWAAEAYGSDAVTVLSYIAAQDRADQAGLGHPPDARTHARQHGDDRDDAGRAQPTGAFLLGLGLSGPQVVEGWHGVPYGKPLTRTREYVEIVRRSSRARSRWSSRARSTRSPTRARVRPGWASR